MDSEPFRLLKCTLAACVLFGVETACYAGEPYQKGYSDTKGSSSYCYDCQHHGHLKHPPRSPVASAIAAPQFVVAQSQVVNPLSANGQNIDPNVLRALASMIDDRADAAASPAENADSPGQKGNSTGSAVASPQASGQRDLETEVKRLEDKLRQLEETIQKLNESTTRVLESLSRDS